MADPEKPKSPHASLDRAHFPQLLEVLRAKGYGVVGPTRQDGAIIYDVLTSVEDLPIGWTDDQDAGTYRLKRRADDLLFGYAAGPHSWKKFLNPPVRRLWQATRHGTAFQIAPEQEESAPLAFLGIRPCDLYALAVQDAILARGAHPDALYRARRDRTCVIAVNCGQAGGTCFCASMQTGPKATTGFDLALTEVRSRERHVFLVEVGTPLGAEILEAIPHEPAGDELHTAAERLLSKTAKQMGRSLDTADLPALLSRSHDHPHWERVAARCLTCANCTLVCPTCFCSTVEDVTDLTGRQAERQQKWDSCFTMDFSYIYGGSLRYSAAARYRQWLTHKLGTWEAQFGTSGCVGCGRCITWCPVGIDITAEARAIREGDQAAAGTRTKAESRGPH